MYVCMNVPKEVKGRKERGEGCQKGEKQMAGG